MMIDSNIPTLQIADSKFVGHVQFIESPLDASALQQSLKRKYPNASHVPFCWVCCESNNRDYNDKHTNNDNYQYEIGYDEDGEPEKSCGQVMIEETQRYYNECVIKQEGENKNRGIVLAIVRFFGERLLGVTCGRLTQCYQSISNLTFHHFFHGHDTCLQLNYNNDCLNASKYGMGAGDCEVILNVLGDVEGSNDSTLFTQKIINELDFQGFKGNKHENLPRLQNLQSNVSSGIVPVYRYPGNYRGDEWETFEWSHTSLEVRNAVDKHLKPLYSQEMNHCVSNYYRDGKDFIDHHSDKDLDLDIDAVIVSVSLGDERTLELKRRTIPKDTIRINLPHGSMLVLGPFTNKYFTHSILKKENSTKSRVSMTFRHVTTFIDLKTKRLFGQGVVSSSLSEVRHAQLIANLRFVLGFASILLVLNKSEKKYNRVDNKAIIKTYCSIGGLFALNFTIYRRVSWLIRSIKDEKDARDFFSKTSVNGTKY